MGKRPQGAPDEAPARRSAGGEPPALIEASARRASDGFTLATAWPLLLGFLIPAAAVVLVIVLAVLRESDPEGDADPPASSPAPVSSSR